MQIYSHTSAIPNLFQRIPEPGHITVSNEQLWFWLSQFIAWTDPIP
jgi:hypothetical protein